MYVHDCECVCTSVHVHRGQKTTFTSEFSPSTVGSGQWTQGLGGDGGRGCACREGLVFCLTLFPWMFLKGEQRREGRGHFLGVRTSKYRKAIHLTAPTDWRLWVDLLMSLTPHPHGDSWDLWWALTVIIHRLSEAPSESVLGRMWDLFFSLQKTALDWSFCLWEGNHWQVSEQRSSSRKECRRASASNSLLSQWGWADKPR